PTTVRLTFKQPTGGWYVPFVGGVVLPKHALEQYVGTASRDAPFNLKAFGTGPYMVQEFKPGDVLTLVVNPNYRDANKPFFKQIDIKGGGDAVSAARAVLQTGEYDYAWNLQVEAQVLNGLLQGGKGDLVLGAGGGVEQVIFQQAGFRRGGDTIRVTPDGVRMNVIYQTTINSLRQKEQDIVKQGWQSIGIETELKTVDASIFFSADAGNPDTNSKFYTDVEMFTSTFGSPFPLNYMKLFYSGDPAVDISQKSNQWAARNYTRWVNADLNKIYDQVKGETDTQKAMQLWIQLNDI